MEYLLSLVGKDEETIAEAIKEMANNLEKFKVQEKEIKKLYNELDDKKEEIHYLRNKVDQKYDIIEDMEKELDQADKKYSEAKDEIQYQNNVKANHERMISELNEMRQETEERCLKLEHELHELKDELKQTSKLVEEQEDVKNLLEDIKHLENMNEEKELEIENIEKENKDLQIKLNVLESKEKERSLDEELGYSMGRNFKCKECDTKFASNETLRMHKRSVHGEKCEVTQIRFLLQGLENQILEQKLDLTNKISMMKETESNGRLTCKCIGWCAISHTKHSWKKSLSEEFHHKFQNLIREKHLCNICEAKFENVNQLENRMQAH